MGKLKPEEWTKYWSQGTITTFGGGFDNNYDLEFADFWGQQLDSGREKILDLCCGNGALVWLAHDIYRQREDPAHIIGIDLAEINPFKLLDRNPTDYPGVEFIGGTSIDALPFEDNSVDMVVSQYGVEYSDLKATIAEITRVLNNQGKMAFIVHSEDSDVVSGTNLTAGKYQYILNESNFFETALSLDKLFNSKQTFSQLVNDERYIRLVGRLNRTSYHVHNMHSGAEVQFEESKQNVKEYINNVLALFNGSSAIKSAKRKGFIEEWQRIAETTVSRIEDLNSAALSSQQLSELKKDIVSHGYTITMDKPIYYSAAKLFYGQGLVATRQ